jgi:hypothetical protein
MVTCGGGGGEPPGCCALAGDSGARRRAADRRREAADIWGRVIVELDSSMVHRIYSLTYESVKDN